MDIGGVGPGPTGTMMSTAAMKMAAILEVTAVV